MAESEPAVEKPQALVENGHEEQAPVPAEPAENIPPEVAPEMETQESSIPVTEPLNNEIQLETVQEQSQAFTPQNELPAEAETVVVDEKQQEIVDETVRFEVKDAAFKSETLIFDDKKFWLTPNFAPDSDVQYLTEN